VTTVMRNAPSRSCWTGRLDDCDARRTFATVLRLRPFVHLFTNALELRCLDQIRARIQELCVADLSN
jgi:hypothetical protein